MAYVREGEGGFPLLLLHGWPETKRIWWRNVEPLAAAGFEVIVPDLAGFGDSGPAEDDHYDVAAHARDMHALVSDVLGHSRCVTAGGGRRHIVNLSHGVDRATPVANFEAFVRAARGESP